MSATALELPPVRISFKSRTMVNRFAVRVALAVTLVIAAVAIAVFLYIALKRLTYPYELEWLESGILEHANRLANGDALYSSPSVDFTQLPYAPFSFAVGAAIAVFTGPHFWIMRVISIAATVASFWLIHALVKRETSSAVAGFVSAGIYAATYQSAGWWFDVGKPDSLFVAMTLAAILVARCTRSHQNAIVAAAVMTLAVLTKQTAIFVLAPIAAYLLITKWRVGLSYLATVAVLLGGTTLALNAITHGWYLFFTWELLFQHEVLHGNEKLFFTRDMVHFLPIVAMVLVAAPHLLKRENLWMTGFWSVTIFGLFAGAFSSRLHSGGAENVLMPAFAGAAIAAGLSLGFTMQNSKRTLLIVVMCALSVVQFNQLRYDPTGRIPTSEDRLAVRQFVNWLRTVPGDVWVVDHPAYALLAEKESFAGEGGMEDVLRGHDWRAQGLLQDGIAEAIHNQRFSAIVLDGQADARGFPDDWKMFYEQMPGVAMPSGKGHPIVNKTGIPSEVWVPIGHPVKMPLQ